jgi:hypothetical protein
VASGSAAIGRWVVPPAPLRELHSRPLALREGRAFALGCLWVAREHPLPGFGGVWCAWRRPCPTLSPSCCHRVLVVPTRPPTGAVFPDLCLSLFPPAAPGVMCAFHESWAIGGRGNGGSGGEAPEDVCGREGGNDNASWVVPPSLPRALHARTLALREGRAFALGCLWVAREHPLPGRDGGAFRCAACTLRD